MIEEDRIRSRAVLFAEDLQQAFLLRRQFEARAADIRFLQERENRRIIYAIDTTVFYGYFYPVSEHNTQDRDLLIFSGDGSDADVEDKLREASVTLTSTLCRYVIDTCSTTQPNLLLPGHADECSSLYHEFVKKLRKQPETYQSVKARFLDILTRMPSASGEATDRFLSENATDLHSLLYELEGPHDALDRFKTLFVDERLMTSEAASGSNKFGEMHRTKHGRHPLAASSDEYVAESERFGREWVRENIHRRAMAQAAGNDHRLARRRKYKDSGAFSDDVKALKRLYLLNKRCGPDTRIVLITLDDTLADLGRNLMGVHGEESFTDTYIRHPRAFLSSSNIMRPAPRRDGSESSEDETGTDFQGDDHEGTLEWGWLDTLLASFDKKIDVSEFDDDALTYSEKAFNQLVQRAHEALRENDRAHAELVDSWVRHIGAAVTAHSTTSALARNQIKELFEEDFGEPTKMLGRLRGHVEELTERSWTNFFETTAKAGYDLVGDAPSTAELLKRALPIAVFTQHPDANSVSSVLVNGLDLSVARKSVLKNIQDLLTVDPGGYIHALAFSLLFAYADRWEVADLLARRAIQVYKRMKRLEGGALFDLVSDGRISGREAYYLAASYARILATDEGELDDVSTLLVEADKAMQREQRAAASGLKNASPSSDLTGLRFRSESISVDVSRLMLQLFGKPGAQPASTNNLYPAVEELISRIRKELDQPDPCADTWVCERVELNLLTNLFLVLFVLDRGGHDVSELIPSKQIGDYVTRAYALNGGIDHWVRFGQYPIPKRADHPAPSRLDRVTCIYAIARFEKSRTGEDLPMPGFLSREVRSVDYLLYADSDLVLATHYDRVRYDALLEAISVELGMDRLKWRRRKRKRSHPRPVRVPRVDWQ